LNTQTSGVKKHNILGIYKKFSRFVIDNFEVTLGVELSKEKLSSKRFLEI
jgi:hypothetical protein